MPDVDLEALDRDRKLDTRGRRILCNHDAARDITRQYHVIVPETGEQACPEDQYTDLALARYHFKFARFGKLGCDRYRVREYETNANDGSETTQCAGRL